MNAFENVLLPDQIYFSFSNYMSLDIWGYRLGDVSDWKQSLPSSC